MFIKQLYTSCLSQAAYYVESDGEAIVIDPMRDPSPYILLAEERSARIRYVFETHFHADFVSGHIDLSKKTGAVIVFGPGAKPDYQALTAFDGETFTVGKIRIKVIHTPGHTLESSCFLIYNKGDKPYCIFTGDTLFVGDVGRPDLLSGNVDKVKLAGLLFDSITKKIKTLPDEVIVYPGHGAGSACGKNIGKETVTTIGEQKKNNYALNCNTRDEFISVVTFGLDAPPSYFFKDALINIKGYKSYDEQLKNSLKPLNAESFCLRINEGAQILDSRNPEEFAKRFINGSLNIGLDGAFAIWAGSVLEFNQALILVTEKGKETETVGRLLRIGYDNILGYLNDEFPGDLTTSIESLDYFGDADKLENYVMLDVRNTSEFHDIRFNNAVNIPLSILPQRIDRLNAGDPIAVCCAGGYRSMIAASILKLKGFANVVNIKGGVNAYRDRLQGLEAAE
jgi:hydroxyacylglutathione hydrolase